MSHDDELQGESNSISNQKQMLEEFARKNGFSNIRHFTDDGISGIRFDRPGFQSMLEQIENGSVRVVSLIKYEKLISKEDSNMIIKFRGMNISSKNPKRLALFYQDVLGLKMLDNDPNYDGVTFGNDSNEPIFWIWDENKWGKSNEGSICFVFDCDDHDKAYQELKQRGVSLDPPKTAVWGGKELYVKDPDGNTILIL